MKSLVKVIVHFLFLSQWVIWGGMATEAWAEGDVARLRTITVVGEAKQGVAPDQAVLSLSLVNKDKDMKVAKAANDAMADRLVTIAKDYGITKEKIAESAVYIAPQYNDVNNEQVFAGYSMTRSLNITMSDVSKEELFLSAIVTAKIEQVDGVNYQLADREKHASALRTQAFENAKAKATLLAQAAGAKLGQPLTITAGDVAISQPRPMPVFNAAMTASAASVGPTLPGQISLQETVQVTFAME